MINPRPGGDPVPTETRKRLGAAWSEARASAPRAAYLGVLYALSWLPPRLAFRLAEQVGRTRFERSREELAPRVMMTAMRFGVDPATAEGWLARAFQLRACDELEHFLYRLWTKENLSRYVEIRGREHLDAALAAGRGAILTSGHFNSTHSVFMALAVQGMKLTVMYRDRVPSRLTHRLEKWFHADWQRVFERRFGGSLLYTNPPSPLLAAQMLTVLRRNEVIYTLVDVWSTQQTIDLDLLGTSVPFPQGPYQLARAAGAPLLFIHPTRAASLTRLVITIDPPIPVTRSAEETIERQAAAFEAPVRADPAIWSSQLFRI